MKTRFIILICLIPAFSFSQSKTYTIKGKVGNYSSPAKMFLTYTYPGEKTALDSAKIENGHFEFKGNLAMPINASLILKKTTAKIPLSKIGEENQLLLYIEPGIININGGDSLSKSTIKGGNLNKDYVNYLQKINPVVNSLKQVLKAFSQDRTITGDQATIKIDSLMLFYDKLHQDFIASHLTSPVSIYVLESLIANDKNLDQASNLFQKLSPNVKQQGRAVSFKESLAKKKKALYSQKPTHIGAQAPDFEQPDVSGNKVVLSQFKGKYLLLDFWASWCKPCRAENPNLVEAYHKFNKQGLEIMSVSLDGMAQKKAWLNAIRIDGLPWVQVSDLKAWENSAALIYGIKAIPENYLIDPTGKIIAKNLRGEELNTMLTTVFKE
jgi:peroxiredoxin